MPQEPNKALRIIVPILLIGGGVFIAWSVLQNTSRHGTKGSTPATAPAMPVTPASTAPGADATKPAQPAPTGAGKPSADAKPATPPEQLAVVPPPAEPTPAQPSPGATTGGYSAVFYPAGSEKPFDAIGGLDPAQPYVLELQFSPIGAGLKSLSLRDHYETIAKKTHERIQEFHPNPRDPRLGFAPLAVSGVEVSLPGGGVQFINLAFDPEKAGSYWRQTEPGAFEATIVGPDKAPAAKVVREFDLEQGSYDVVLEQHVENLTQQPLSLKWYQFGPTELPMGTVRYGGDKRRVRFGYLLNPQIDPSRQIVEARRFLIERNEALGKPTPGGAGGAKVYPGKTLWPNADSGKGGFTLVWLAMTNRYFGVALHPLTARPAPAGAPVDKSFSMVAAVDRFVLPGADVASSVIMLRITSNQLTIAPGGAARLDMGAYAGPLSRDSLSTKREPRAAAVGLGEIVVANFGGPCAICTFQTITYLLHDFLTVLRGYVVFDWGLAIILLVVCVRTILHPVTKRSQISMQRFGKQMQALAPKQKAIQEKYKSDPVKMREELARLMREEHVNYAGMLGCLPAFLQTPIWIALSAMLFFTFELRQTPAFFGVFQNLSQAVAGVRWTFMADLSEPDHFIAFGDSYRVPLLSSLMGPIDGINLLPMLMGVVFFIQQKYLTPPSTTPLTPEQEQQKKIMKVMMVGMFPLLMYNAPCGLALYFLCNSSLGILESRYIRSHVDKLDLLAPKKKDNGGPKKPGFFQRFQEQVLERQKMAEKLRAMEAKRKVK